MDSMNLFTLKSGEPESLGYLENHPADNNLFALSSFTIW